mmetsp:Transcript_106687/g.254720  ORF Transcript_106687/g.254720 Transcript_106687/m.254720 type:complete len:262 (+) Transcript_106687:53-838(+)
MSLTSSTEKMSRLARSSAALPSSGLDFQAVCFCCHSKCCFCQAMYLLPKSWDGWRCSMSVVLLASKIHLLRYSLHLGAGSQANLTSSKPSDFSGRLNWCRNLLRVVGAKSAAPFARKILCFSSSVSSAFGGSSPSPSSSSSLASSFTSSSFSSFISSSLVSPSPSSFFLASSSFFFRCSSALRRISWSSRWRLAAAFLAFHSVSSFACFSASKALWDRWQKSSSGAPMTTSAVFLKLGVLKRLRSSTRSSFSRLLFTSMTT